MTKRLSLSELKQKAATISTTEAMKAITGGADIFCHDGGCPKWTPLTPDKVVYKG